MKRGRKFQALAVLFLLPAGIPVSNAAESTLKDQKSVEVTAYNSNIGLIKDTREIQIPEGEGVLQFMDVAALINPVTVSVRNLAEGGKFSLLEQNYEYDLISHEKLLDKYVGKSLKIMQWNEFQDRKEVVDAVLVSNNAGQVYKIGNEIYLGHEGTKILPEIPENLIEKPTLSWIYANQGAAARTLEVSYLTSGINWHADYIFTLDENDRAADLSGWVTLDNHSGASYENAKLKLVAGDVNMVQPEAAPEMKMMAMRASYDAAAPQFQERGFFEYHIYDLNRQTTLKDNQTKQIRFAEASNVAVEKKFVVEALPHFFYGGYPRNDAKQPVSVFLKFQNKAENNLGIPLPAGTLRIYKKDTDGTLQFAGEDRVRHTPKDEEIELKAGNAFDITAERRQMEYHQRTHSQYETEWEIKIRNHKDTDVVVHAVERFGTQWELLQNSHPYEKKDAFTVEFKVPVPAGKEETLKYRVLVGL